MNTHCLLVTSSPKNNDIVAEVSRYLQLSNNPPFSIDHIFFYGAGVFNASVSAPNNQINCLKWKSIAETYNTELLVCVTAATKRGIYDRATALETGNNLISLKPPFENVGLADFFSRLHNCNQVKQF